VITKKNLPLVITATNKLANTCQGEKKKKEKKKLGEIEDRKEI
jgi:hypothetical protein